MIERHQNGRGVDEPPRPPPAEGALNADIRTASGGQASTSEATFHQQPRGADDQIVHFQRR